MTAKSYYRGHRIEYLNDSWVYKDNNRLVEAFPNRQCGYCEELNTKEGHDGCLGTLPGVMNACCGHGNTEEAYIQYPDGTSVQGEKAIKLFKELKWEA